MTVHDLDLDGGPTPDEDREGGWGLGLVAYLAEDAALEEHQADGKTAWFRVSRGG